MVMTSRFLSLLRDIQTGHLLIPAWKLVGTSIVYTVGQRWICTCGAHGWRPERLQDHRPLCFTPPLL
jgi:hypothetical protein